MNGGSGRGAGERRSLQTTANLPAKIVDFRGFDSSIILILRGGILMSIGEFPESLSQRILVGISLVGRLGVPAWFGKTIRVLRRTCRVPEHLNVYMYIYIYTYIHTYIHVFICNISLSIYIYIYYT